MPYIPVDPWRGFNAGMNAIQQANALQSQREQQKEALLAQKEQQEFEREMARRQDARAQGDALRQQQLFEAQMGQFKDERLAHQAVESTKRMETMVGLAANVNNQEQLDNARQFFTNMYGEEAAQQIPSEWNEDTASQFKDFVKMGKNFFSESYDTYWLEDEEGNVIPANYPKGQDPPYDQIEKAGFRFSEGPEGKAVKERMALQQEYAMQLQKQQQGFLTAQNQNELAAKMSLLSRELDGKQNERQREDRIRLTQDFSKEPENKRFQVVASQMSMFNEAKAMADRYREENIKDDDQKWGTVDQVYGMTFNKALAPNSAVMPSEFDRFGITRSMFDNATKLIEKQSKGGIFLPHERQEMEEFMSRLYAAQVESQAKMVDKYVDRAQYDGLDDPGDYDYITGGTWSQIQQYRNAYKPSDIPPEEQVDDDMIARVRKRLSKLNIPAFDGDYGPSNQDSLGQQSMPTQQQQVQPQTGWSNSAEEYAKKHGIGKYRK